MDAGPGESLRSLKGYSAQFANPGVWNKEKGFNILTTITVKATLPATGSSNEWTPRTAIAGGSLVLLGIAATVIARRRRVA